MIEWLLNIHTDDVNNPHILDGAVQAVVRKPDAADVPRFAWLRYFALRASGMGTFFEPAGDARCVAVIGKKRLSGPVEPCTAAPLREYVAANIPSVNMCSKSAWSGMPRRPSKMLSRDNLPGTTLMVEAVMRKDVFLTATCVMRNVCNSNEKTSAAPC